MPGHRSTSVDDETDLVVVTMVFDTTEPEPLAALLSRYVVLSRGDDGCRNIDLLVSALQPGRFTIIQKWDSPTVQRAHFDSPDMVAMAEAVGPLLSSAPRIELHRAVSAHDLR